VLNTGSSSVKFALYSIKEDALLIKGRLEGFKEGRAELVTEEYFKVRPADGEILQEEPIHIKDIHNAVPFVIDLLLKRRFLRSLDELAAVGHRVVHGGERYQTATVVDTHVIRDIQTLSKFAPLHNPFNLEGITRCQKLLPKLQNVAVFDTAFHQTMPKETFLYGIPTQLYDKYAIRKYGFHGTNHKYCSRAAKELLGALPKRMVTCHLGNGSSVTAVKNGYSIDTSMGFTPTDGIIMGTRSGAIDPEVVLFLLHELRMGPEKINELLNKHSGFKAIAGTSDMREIWLRTRKGDKDALLALHMLQESIAKYVGSYVTELDGLDCLVFTGGIGENAWYVRKGVCDQLGCFGVKLDAERNRANERVISADDSKVVVLVIPANEELQIGRETKALVC